MIVSVLSDWCTKGLENETLKRRAGERQEKQREWEGEKEKGRQGRGKFLSLRKENCTSVQLNESVLKLIMDYSL